MPQHNLQARNITGMVIGATKSLVVDIAFLIESQLQEVRARPSLIGC
jgi:hypothetical protein